MKLGSGCGAVGYVPYIYLFSGDPPRYQNWPIFQKASLNKHEQVLNI